MQRTLILFLFVQVLIASCTSKDAAAPKVPVFPPPPPAAFYTGADVSWVTEMEAAGRVFKKSDGQPQDLFPLLKGMGMDVIRLRVWVNPADGYNATADVLAKAKRAQATGFKLLIDFHYSDSWADPGQQTKPAAWATYSLAQLQGAVYAHTRAVLDTLKSNGITVSWVQVGNETKNGMLWPEGRASTHMAQFARFVDTGYAAVKAVDPAIKVIVHLDAGQDNALYRWLFDGLRTHSARYDVIGMSLYPPSGQWQTYVEQAQANVEDVTARYQKPAFLVEVGYPEGEAANSKLFLSNLKSRLKAAAAPGVIGILYWEPQSYNWKNYRLSAWGADGRPTEALEGLVN